MGVTQRLGTIPLAIQTDSSNNVGIGGTPSGTYGKLSVFGGVSIKDDNNAKLEIGRYSIGAANSYIKIGTNSASLRITNAADSADLVTFTNSGNVGIGTSSPSRLLTVVSSSDGITAGISGATYGIRFDNGGTFSSGMSTIHGVDSTLTGSYQPIMINGSDVRFGTSATERMRITSVGDVYIGNSTISTANTAIFLQKSGIITTVRAYSSGTIPLVEFYKQSAGDIGSISYNGTNTLYNSTSDYRLKEDLKDYNAIEIIGKLKTYDFKWKDTDVRDYGMMAHELQEILPNYVTGEKDAIKEDGAIKPQGVDYSKIVPILVKAIQEQNQLIQELSAKVTALENK